MSNALNVDDETYARLDAFAGRIRSAQGRPASLNEALARLLDEFDRPSPLVFAGAWAMTDEEAEHVRSALATWWDKRRGGS